MRAGGVAQQMLQNGLAEVLCNVIHSLHPTSSATSLDVVVHADVERLFVAVAHVTSWYFHVICQFMTSSLVVSAYKVLCLSCSVDLSVSSITEKVAH